MGNERPRNFLEGDAPGSRRYVRGAHDQGGPDSARISRRHQPSTHRTFSAAEDHRQGLPLREVQGSYWRVDAPSRLVERSIQLVVVDSANRSQLSLWKDRYLDSAAANHWYILEVSSGEVVVDQIGEALRHLIAVDTIHLIGIGDGHSIRIGDFQLDNHTGLVDAARIAKWGDQLSPGANISVYGCNLSRTPDGRRLIRSLAALCRCEVKSSDNDAGDELDPTTEWQTERLDPRGCPTTAHACSSVCVQPRWSDDSRCLANEGPSLGSSIVVSPPSLQASEGRWMANDVWAAGFESVAARLVVRVSVLSAASRFVGEGDCSREAVDFLNMQPAPVHPETLFVVEPPDRQGSLVLTSEDLGSFKRLTVSIPKSNDLGQDDVDIAAGATESWVAAVGRTSTVLLDRTESDPETGPPISVELPIDVANIHDNRAGICPTLFVGERINHAHCQIDQLGQAISTDQSWLVQLAVQWAEINVVAFGYAPWNRSDRQAIREIDDPGVHYALSEAAKVDVNPPRPLNRQPSECHVPIKAELTSPSAYTDGKTRLGDGDAATGETIFGVQTATFVACLAAERSMFVDSIPLTVHCVLTDSRDALRPEISIGVADVAGAIQLGFAGQILPAALTVMRPWFLNPFPITNAGQPIDTFIPVGAGLGQKTQRTPVGILGWIDLDRRLQVGEDLCSAPDAERIVAVNQSGQEESPRGSEARKVADRQGVGVGDCFEVLVNAATTTPPDPVEPNQSSDARSEFPLAFIDALVREVILVQNVDWNCDWSTLTWVESVECSLGAPVENVFGSLDADLAAFAQVGDDRQSQLGESVWTAVDDNVARTDRDAVPFGLELSSGLEDSLGVGESVFTVRARSEDAYVRGTMVEVRASSYAVLVGDLNQHEGCTEVLVLIKQAERWNVFDAAIDVTTIGVSGSLELPPGQRDDGSSMLLATHADLPFEDNGGDNGSDNGFGGAGFTERQEDRFELIVSNIASDFAGGTERIPICLTSAWSDRSCWLDDREGRAVAMVTAQPRGSGNGAKSMTKSMVNSGPGSDVTDVDPWGRREHSSSSTIVSIFNRLDWIEAMVFAEIVQGSINPTPVHKSWHPGPDSVGAGLNEVGPTGFGQCLFGESNLLIALRSLEVGLAFEAPSAPENVLKVATFETRATMAGGMGWTS